jgi:hypothetical protein
MPFSSRRVEYALAQESSNRYHVPLAVLCSQRQSGPDRRRTVALGAIVIYPSALARGTEMIVEHGRGEGRQGAVLSQCDEALDDLHLRIAPHLG